MKTLLLLATLSALGLTMYGCSDTGKASVVKTPVANTQFKGSDHMPPEAVAAKKSAGY